MQKTAAAKLQQSIFPFLANALAQSGPKPVRIDTHASTVFLTADRAFKLKKEIWYPFLDYSTPERRARFCLEELRLNRRTAPELYLGIQPVIKNGDGFYLGELVTDPDAATISDHEGADTEWMVVMRRFDEANLFSRMAESGTLDRALMDDTARQIARLHNDAEQHTDIDSAGDMRWVIDDNLAGLKHFAGNVFDDEAIAAFEHASNTAFDQIAELLNTRARTGFVRRCHGDLHLRNICLIANTPTLFDCIEFNDRFAIIDTFYDLAFLLMDLDHGGMRDMANAVLNRYVWESDDIEGLALLPLFMAQRACVRAKVTAAGIDAQENPAEQAAMREEARAYLALANDYLSPAAPVLMAVGGLSGTGKTTQALQRAPFTGPAPGAIVVRTDIIRKKLAGVSDTTRLPESAYTLEMRDRVYDAFYDTARRVIATGHAAIADAVFSKPGERGMIEKIARDAGVDFQGLWLEAEPQILFKRVSARIGDASDATEDVVRKQLEYDLGNINWKHLNTGGERD